MKHQKHTKLAKPTIGNFARNEIALVGAPCGLIQDFAKKLIKEFNDRNVTYVDADHAHGDSESPELSFNELSDKIKYERLDKKTLNEYDKRILLYDQDLVITNGNHFEANSQIVFIHPAKEASLRKRFSQLTNIKAYILCDGVSKVFDWLEVCAPIFGTNDAPAIAKLIKAQISLPEVKGLVLAGGKSIRMGQDKGQINYHGKSQVDFLLGEFEKLKLTSSVSCRIDQYKNHNRITDKFEGLGPFGAIASAFQEDPNAAWLVVACDLPLVDQYTFELLLTERDPSKLATCFYNPETDFPDPLLTLWEPKAYMRLLEFLALGYSCPRKVLINSDIKVLNLGNPEILKNVNTPAEKNEFLVK